MKTLATTLSRGNNNFDLIRLLAALAVMFGHSFGIHGGNNLEWGLAFTRRESFGSLAVYAFFLVSGMLVSASYVEKTSPWRFVASRALRIWPGAMVCALFIGLVIGPVFNSDSLSSYFASSTTQCWFLHNITLMGGVSGLNAILPGVFMHNHIQFFVSATVWTLPIELECYVIVLMLGLCGVLTSRLKMPIIVGLLGIAFAYFVHQPPTHFALGGFFTKPLAYSFYPVPFFLLGMLLYTYREHVVLHWLPAIALIVVYLLNRHNSVGFLLLYPAFAYGVLWIASLPFLSVLQPRHDYSYGIYLYGFVVQQSLTAIFPAWSNYMNVALAMPAAALVAAASWHFVERPCLALVRKGERLRPMQQLAKAA